jgi:ferredoxin-type protein NapG
MSGKRNDSEGAVSDRRSFLIKTFESLGLATLGGIAWGGAMGPKASPPALRPPGAGEEERFIAACIKCGLCVEACPYHALELAAPRSGVPIGTPHFTARVNPCRMCEDVPCVAACPTGALDRTLVSEQDAAGKERLAINRSRMGIAVLDRETCVAYWGVQCDACYRACPLMDKAITVEYGRNERTGKHAMMVPIVHGDACTGCGMCEHACVTKKASIFILPRALATGESDVRYVRGWDAKDEERIRTAPDEVVTKTKRSEKTPLEYLNDQDVMTSE